MDFDAEDIDIMLPLLVASGKINFLSILSKSRRRLVWIKPWLKRISTKSVSSQQYIETTTTRPLWLPKIFSYEFLASSLF